MDECIRDGRLAGEGTSIAIHPSITIHPSIKIPTSIKLSPVHRDPDVHH